ILFVSQFDEAESLGAPRFPVHDDLGRLHRAMRREHLFQSAVGHAVGQVADVQFPAHLRPLPLLGLIWRVSVSHDASRPARSKECDCTCPHRRPIACFATMAILDKAQATLPEAVLMSLPKKAEKGYLEITDRGAGFAV